MLWPDHDNGHTLDRELGRSKASIARGIADRDRRSRDHPNDQDPSSSVIALDAKTACPVDRETREPAATRRLVFQADRGRRS